MINRAKRLIARFAVSGRSYVALEQRCQALAAKVIRFHRANQVLKRRLAALREGQEKLREGSDQSTLGARRSDQRDPRLAGDFCRGSTLRPRKTFADTRFAAQFYGRQYGASEQGFDDA